jgi:hypothetical protein
MMELATGAVPMSSTNDFNGCVELWNAMKRSHGERPFDISSSLRQITREQVNRFIPEKNVKIYGAFPGLLSPILSLQVEHVDDFAAEETRP